MQQKSNVSIILALHSFDYTTYLLIKDQNFLIL